jgi:hypothetical protein
MMVKQCENPKWDIFYIKNNTNLRKEPIMIIGYVPSWGYKQERRGEIDGYERRKRCYW